MKVVSRETSTGLTKEDKIRNTLSKYDKQANGHCPSCKYLGKMGIAKRLMSQKERTASMVKIVLSLLVMAAMLYMGLGFFSFLVVIFIAVTQIKSSGKILHCPNCDHEFADYY